MVSINTIMWNYNKVGPRKMVIYAIGMISGKDHAHSSLPLCIDDLLVDHLQALTGRP